IGADAFFVVIFERAAEAVADQAAGYFVAQRDADGLRVSDRRFQRLGRVLQQRRLRIEAIRFEREDLRLEAVEVRGRDVDQLERVERQRQRADADAERLRLRRVRGAAAADEIFNRRLEDLERLVDRRR